MNFNYLFRTSLVILFLSVSLSAQAPPTATNVFPRPVLAPAVPGPAYGGTFTITGSNLQGGEIFTDGPLALLGSSTVNPSGTSIQRSYQIGCCGPYEGQPFNLFVVTPSGVSVISNVITLSQSVPTLIGASPNPVIAPSTPGPPLSGIVSITGTNLAGGEIYTDGPLLLLGSSSVNGSGTSIERSFEIGCCGPYQGQVFNFFVVTPSGQAATSAIISLSNPPPNKEACKNNGWRSFTRRDGSAFKNQGDCVSYVNTGQ